MNRYGHPIPDEYLDQPEVRPDLRFFWDAFWMLDTDRQIGMGEGPIPFSAIDRYARRYRIEGLDEFDRFVAIIGAMDVELRRAREAQKALKVATSTKEPPAPKRRPKPL